MRCFGHYNQVSSKYGMVRCQNWHACHMSETVNFMCWVEVLKKNIKFGAWMHTFNFACLITEKHVLIQNAVIFMSLDDEWNASQSGFVSLMESSMKKSFKFDEMCFELKWKVLKWMGSDVLETWKCFSLKNFGLWNKIRLKRC